MRHDETHVFPLYAIARTPKMSRAITTGIYASLAN